MSVGVKYKPPVKNPQLPAEYPEGTEYVEPQAVQAVHDPELLKELFAMKMSPPPPKVGPQLEQ